MERQNHGTFLDQVGEANEATALVRQHEIRHRFAGMGGALSDAVGLEPRDHAVDDGGEFRTEPAYLVGDRL